MLRISLQRKTRQLQSHRLFSSGAAQVHIKDLGDGAVLVKLQKPPVNTFDISLLREFQSTIKHLESDGAVRGLILASAQPRVFSAGLDLTRFEDARRSAFEEYWGLVEATWQQYYTSPLATVSAIAGACPAMGAVLALSSDYRIMADHPKYAIGLLETTIGLPPPLWLCELASKSLGHRGAERHLQLGSMLKADAALGVGMVDEVVSEDRLLQVAEERLRELLRIPDAARSLTKQRQRRDTAALAGAASCKATADVVVTDEFQQHLRTVLAGLRSKSPKK